MYAEWGGVLGNHQGGSVYDKYGISPSLIAGMSHGNVVPYILEINKMTDKLECFQFEQEVKVRKYAVDIERLKECLRSHKTMSTEEIANAMNVSLTRAAHWFRKDKYFAIPEAEIWMKLKNLLKIDTDEFDESIMTFEIKKGVFEKGDRVYLDSGVNPTITTDGSDKILEVTKVTDELVMLGQMDAESDHTFECINRVYSNEGLCPTITTMEGGNRQPKVMECRLVDTSMMGIEGVPRVYDDIAPTLQARDYKEPRMMVECKELKNAECIRLGNVYNDEKFTGGNFGGNVWDTVGLAPAMKTGASTGQQCVIEQQIVAMRGRDPDNPSDRSPGNTNLEQRLEPNHEGICNTITTVQKDNLVLEKEIYSTRMVRDDEGIGLTLFESDKFGGMKVKNDGTCPTIRANKVCDGYIEIKQATKQGYAECEVGGVADLSYPTSLTRRGRVIDQGNVSPTLTTENVPSVLEKWIWEIDGVKYWIRIRKLTPRECWRLMDFTDEDFNKAEAVNSNTQLYKQAGNSIVKNVLCEVFSQLLKED